MRDEAERMARVCAGEPEAFESLVEAYWPVVYRTAYGILRDAELSEDAAQDCFADLYMQRHRYQPRFSFQAYVTAIARHKSADLLRKRGNLHPGARGPWKSFDDATPESVYVRKHYMHALYAAVERLPERQRRMLVAFALEGASYRQIAGELGITTVQVRVALHRVRKALRRVKEEWEA